MSTCCLKKITGLDLCVALSAYKGIKARFLVEIVMVYGNILLERRDPVALIRLNRPEVHNALNNALMSELSDALKACLLYTSDAADE